MRPRKEIVEIFSKFAQFEEDRFNQWVEDARLRRSMQGCLEREPQSHDSASFWGIYWHRIWQAQTSGQIAEMHLSAYLQECCYWASQRVATKRISTQYKLADYFQLAIAQVDKVFKGFDSKKYDSLKFYGSLVFPTIIRDTLRQRHEADLCTDLTLLRKVSRKRFLESLQDAGLPLNLIRQYELAWSCFKELYASTSLQGEQPDSDHHLWEAITKLYNKERQNQINEVIPSASSETIQQWMIASAKWVRTYLYPPIDSLNVSKPGRETGEVQDDLLDLRSESLLTDLITQEEVEERQALRNQVDILLSEAIQKLDADAQALLQMYYGLDLTQKQIKQETGLPQATISHRLSRSRRLLLNALLDWSKTTLNISPDSTLIKERSKALEEWLRSHYDQAGFSEM
jgi:RNA polymerase sigma factor (sigma-70 family)